jgi:dTDP-L-rhamnose 4-epimerase
MRILVTGGCGFVGYHLVERLLEDGHQVAVLDNLDPEVHPQGRAPAWIDYRRVKIHLGDVRDVRSVMRAADGADCIVHLAAKVGVARSMERPQEFLDVNSTGTAAVLEAGLILGVTRYVVASSASIYGEGSYSPKDVLELRSAEDLDARRWEFPGVTPIATPETKQAAPASVYACSKLATEQVSMAMAAAAGAQCIALRFSSIYGPRQSLSSGYTAFMPNILQAAEEGRPITIFEDGEQTRDFVYISDVVEALRLAATNKVSGSHVLNIGSGSSDSINHVVDVVLKEGGYSDHQIDRPGTWRLGDIRHCVLDSRRAEEVLGYRAKVKFETGAGALVRWYKDGPRGW